MTETWESARRYGDRLVAKRCFVHPEFGNIHVGDVFEVVAREHPSHVTVTRRRVTADVDAKDLRKELLWPD